MQIVRIVLWVIVAVLLTVLWLTNKTPVDLNLGPIAITAYLATFIVAAFLIGLVPMWVLHKAWIWRKDRRIASLEGSLAALSVPTRMPSAADAAPAATPVPAASSDTL